MPRRNGELVGTTRCDECERTSEVRRDRAGHLYVKCEHHTPARVVFTHGAPKLTARIQAKLKPLARPRSALAQAVHQVHVR